MSFASNEDNRDANIGIGTKAPLVFSQMNRTTFVTLLLVGQESW